MLLTDGQKIRLARIGRGMLLRDLEKEVGFSISYLCHVENDRRSVPEKLLKFFEKELHDHWYGIIMETLYLSVGKCITEEEVIYVTSCLNNALQLREGSNASNRSESKT